MVTSAKIASKTPAGKAVKTAVKATAKPAANAPAVVPVKAAKAAAPTQGRSPAVATEPSLRFHHSVALREKTHAVLEALEAAPDHPGHGNAVADLVAELTEAGMDYYFLRGLKLTQAGFVTEQSARLGLSGAVKLISSVSRKFIVRMDRNQLLVVVRHIRDLG
jgi:hypothetical protein